MTVASLAVAIGSNATMFSLIEALILRASPYDRPEELVDIRLIEPNNNTLLSYPAFRGLEASTGQTFEGVAGAMVNIVQLRDDTGRHDNAFHELVAGPYFDVLGVRAQLGRVFDTDEGVGDPGADAVVVLSDEYWRREFGGDPGVIGRTVRLNEFPYTIVGVAAPGYFGMFRGFKSKFWAHMTMADQISINGPGSLEQHHAVLAVIARRAPGVELAEAKAVVGAFAERHFATHSNRYQSAGMDVTPLLASWIHPALDGTVIPVATLAAGILLVLLLLASVNSASFLLARAEQRRHEAAVALALGAGRGRLLGTLLAEATLLALLGGTVGLFLSVFPIEAIRDADWHLNMPVAIDARLNVPVLFFALGLSLAAGLLMGLGPALQSLRVSVSGTLGERARGTRGVIRARSALIVGQATVTVFLLVSASGFARRVVAAQQFDLGFGRHSTAIAWLEPGRDRTPAERHAFYRDFVERVADISGITSAGTVTVLPLETSMASIMGVDVPGIDPPEGQTHHEIDWAGAGGDYFDAMRIPLISGRFFDSSDVRGSPAVAIVNRTMADRFWADRDAVGQRFTASNGLELRVVGVVGDTRVHKLSEAPRPLVYTHTAQMAYPFGPVVAHTTDDPASVIPKMLALGNELDSAAITFSAKTMKQHLSTQLIPLRIPAVLLGTTAISSLLLAAIGVYESSATQWRSDVANS